MSSPPRRQVSRPNERISTDLEFDSPQRLLSWHDRDIEQRLHLGQGGRFTQVNSLGTGVIALSMTIIFYVFLMFAINPFFVDSNGQPLSDANAAPRTDPHDDLQLEGKPDNSSKTSVRQAVQSPFQWIGTLSVMLTLRGPTQHATVFLTFWSFIILAFKFYKLDLQRQALKEEYQVIPLDPGFVVAAGTVDLILMRIRETVDDARHFILFNRIVVALSNLKNLGRVSDVDEVLRSQADNDESGTETSYAVVAGFVWAIPVLGFIGTVLGLSEAIGKFGVILRGAADMETIKNGLKSVTDGLSTAFETTLVALVAALFIQTWIVFLKRSEQQFLDDCSEYCLRNIVNRLRMSTYENERP